MMNTCLKLLGLVDAYEHSKTDKLAAEDTELDDHISSLNIGFAKLVSTNKATKVSTIVWLDY